MATHEKCDNCLCDPGDYQMKPRPEFRYRHWTPGNWLRHGHEAQLAGKKNIVVGGIGEAEVNANATPAEAAKHLNYTAGECGYYSENLTRSEVFDVKYNAVVTEARKHYHTSEGHFLIVWINERLDRIDRIGNEGQVACTTWSRHTPLPE
jgi:hypothetical protein